MCSYNAVNGKPSCANDWLLKTVAREAWGFDGYITSDCGAVADVYNNHHFTATPEETVRDVLAAGTDVDCTSFIAQHGQSAFDKKLITTEDIDARLKMLFRVRMRLSHFDPPGPLQQIPPTEVCTPHAIALAEDGVTQGATLYKNDAKALPLAKSSLKKLAVLGPNANLGHQVTFPPCHQMTLPPCHQMMLPPYHQMMLPPCHQIMLPPYHQMTFPPCHQMTLPPYHQMMLPPCHQMMLPPCHQMMLPPCP